MLAKSVLRSLRLCFNHEKDSKERELARERERERKREIAKDKIYRCRDE